MINWLSLTVIFFVSGAAVWLACWPFRNQKCLIMLAPLLLILSGGGYWFWGAWQAQANFIHHQERERAAQAFVPMMKQPKMLMQTLTQHLAAHPKSARGWYLLGRLYASQHGWKKAGEAFAKAYELQPDNELIAVNYAQSLFNDSHPQSAVTARKILSATLSVYPEQADALLMLAIDAQRRHDYDLALRYWRRLLRLLPQSSPEAARIRKTIEELN